MDGIIVVNKEKDLTSHQVVNIVRRSLGTKKVGHVGTLDPLATGVLVILVEGATKLSPFLMGDDKEYLCEITIGISSNTEDITGEIINKVKVEPITEEQVDQVLTSLVGKLVQLPPLYSAVKLKGKKLYEYARAGLEVERKAREITIYGLQRKSGLEYNDGLVKFSFWSSVSKGTYLRTLCTEIGKRLGYPALMSNLSRLKSGNFTLGQANTIADIASGEYKMIPMLEVLDGFEQIELDERTEKLVTNGMVVPSGIVNSISPLIVFKKNNQLIGIYEKNNLIYKAVRIWKQYL